MKALVKIIIALLVIWMATVLPVFAINQEIYYEIIIASKSKEVKELSKTITELNREHKELIEQIDITNQKIRTISKKLKSVDSKINKTQKALDIFEAAYSQTVRELYYTYENRSSNVFFHAFFSSSNLSDFWQQIMYSERLEQKLADSIMETQMVKAQLDLLKDDYLITAQELSSVKTTLRLQKNDSEIQKNLKQTTLFKTRQEIKRLKKTLDKIRFTLASEDTSISFGQARESANFASDKTGVRTAMILAIIDQESNFGSNVGTGHFPDDMSPEHQEAFLRITAKLGLDPTLVRISKKPVSYSGWGGAMGPAQIMPNYWEFLEPDIIALSGHEQVSPWNVQDAFIAAALILKRNGADSGKYDDEFRSAGIYFAGGNWQNFLWYPQEIMAKAAIYQRLLNAYQ